MDELNQALERMRIALTEKAQSSVTLPTQPLGSTSDAGRLTTLPSQHALPSQSDQGGSKKVNDLPPSISLKPSEKAELAKTLSRICALQRQYGQTRAELETLVDGFAWAIEASGIPFEFWVAGLAKHILQSTDIPRPADILAILNPPEKPKEKLSTAMYINIMKQVHAGKFLYGSDREFVEAYEAQEKAKMYDSDDYRQAKAELANYSKTLQLEHYND